MAAPKQDKEKIAALVVKTKEVFADCLMPNGAVVAAPGHMPYFPARTHKSYLYVWPGRDAGFALTAGLLIGVDYYEPFLAWLWERAENFRKAPVHLKYAEGLLLRSYAISGGVHETPWQPDQNATLMWALQEYERKKTLAPRMQEIAEHLAGGLTKYWANTYFARPTQDLWEERIAHPLFKTNLTYTLASCSFALQWAGERFGRQAYTEDAEEMRGMVDAYAHDADAGYFVRRFGGSVRSIKAIDASMAGLVWPFSVFDQGDARLSDTVRAIEAKLLTPEGVMRYELDEYEGEMEMGGLHYKQGAGAWPLLTFWLSIAHSRLGNKEKAEEYFRLVINQVGDDLLIPEQLFPRHDPRVGIKPLLWSHAMFVHAAHELGYLERASEESPPRR